MEHLVVDCSGKVGRQQVQRMYEEALEAAKSGDMEAAASIARQADKAAMVAKDGPEEYRVPLTEEDIAQRERDAVEARAFQSVLFRAERNARLAASDWTQVPDAPLSAQETAAWARYRQELRDLPEHTDHLDPVWPVTP
jgi:hypothetical protein